jgi:hypothetical protein
VCTCHMVRLCKRSTELFKKGLDFFLVALLIPESYHCPVGAVLVAVAVWAMQHAAANSSCAVHAEVVERTATSGVVGASR